MKQPYAVISQKSGLSQITGRPLTTITLVGLVDRQIYPTYVDTSNHNSKNWTHIVNHPTHGYILDGLKTVIRKGKEIVDADGDPIIREQVTDCDQLYIDIKKAWADLDREKNVVSSKGCKNNFNDLFSGA
jgi:hypothetical protein